MNYFAHTATRPDGTPDPDRSHWQPLATHLRKVAELARSFATPLGLAAEAELATNGVARAARPPRSATRRAKQPLRLAATERRAHDDSGFLSQRPARPGDEGLGNLELRTSNHAVNGVRRNGLPFPELIEP